MITTQKDGRRTLRTKKLPAFPAADGAIQAATVTAGEALGRSQDVGAIAVGRYGDLIAVAGDPIANVGLLQSVAFVMKDGMVVKQTVQTP